MDQYAVSGNIVDIVDRRIFRGTVRVAEGILKLVVQGRYEPSPPVIGFTTGFGLRKGAIASSVAHDGYDVARRYRKRMDALAKQAGATLGAPFMPLSFVTLLVIPELKISDKGIFDGNTFSFISLFVS